MITRSFSISGRIICSEPLRARALCPRVPYGLGAAALDYPFLGKMRRKAEAVPKR